MPVEVAKHLFTVDEYHRMGEAGIFSEDDRIELLEGEIFEMSPVGSRHASCVNRLSNEIPRLLGRTVVVCPQNPIRLNDRSEPQPDICIARWRSDYYRNSSPTPDDTLLVIEIADSTADADRKIKVPLYARAGIPEMWLCLLVDDVVEVHDTPLGDRYLNVRTYVRGQTIQSKSVPGLSLTVDDVLG